MSGSGSGRNLGIEAGWGILGLTSSFAITGVSDVTNFAMIWRRYATNFAMIWRRYANEHRSIKGDKRGCVVADGRVV
jgi:hypothetical protein